MTHLLLAILGLVLGAAYAFMVWVVYESVYQVEGDNPRFYEPRTRIFVCTVAALWPVSLVVSGAIWAVGKL